MKPLRIIDMRVGDPVRDSEGTTGTVVGFKRDGVLIEWEHGETWMHTDEYLRAHGVVKVSTFDVEDTIPG